MSSKLVALDLNTLSWIYPGASKANPKGFDPAAEQAAFLAIAKLTSPQIHFRYPKEGVRGADPKYVTFVEKNLPHLLLSGFFVVGDYMQAVMDNLLN